MMPTRRVLAFVLCSLAATLACDETVSPFVIPGPTVPSRISLSVPYVWDSADEWRDWVDNSVTNAPAVVVGDGPEAFLRVTVESRDTVARASDFNLPPAHVRAVAMRARLRHDIVRPPTTGLSNSLRLVFDADAPPYPGQQPEMRASVNPSDGWQEVGFSSGTWCCLQPLSPRYVYLIFAGSMPATLEIDRLALVP